LDHHDVVRIPYLRLAGLVKWEEIDIPLPYWHLIAGLILSVEPTTVVRPCGSEKLFVFPARIVVVGFVKSLSESLGLFFDEVRITRSVLHAPRNENPPSARSLCPQHALFHNPLVSLIYLGANYALYNLFSH
jgi:hypothetical protein